MKTLQTVLEDADPLRNEPPLSTTDARTIRRQVLGAAETPVSQSFPGALRVAALIVLMIVAGMAAGRRLPDRAPLQSGDDAAVTAPADGERRQVQFATPGGTRIIWTIDPSFQLRGVMP